MTSRMPNGISGLSMLSLLVAELARSFGKRGETPKVLATSATVSIRKLNVDAAMDQNSLGCAPGGNAVL